MGMVLAHCALIMRNPVFTQELTHACYSSVFLIKSKKVKNLEIHDHEKSPYMALLILILSRLVFWVFFHPLFSVAINIYGVSAPVWV